MPDSQLVGIVMTGVGEELGGVGVGVIGAGVRASTVASSVGTFTAKSEKRRKGANR